MVLDYFFARVVGGRDRNADGSARQAIIRRCRVGELLTLVPERDHPSDVDAIRVQRHNGEQLGYLEPAFAGEVVARRAKGATFHAANAGISHPYWGAPYCAALLIIGSDGDASDVEVEQYARELLRRDRPVIAASPDLGRARRFDWVLVGTLVAAVVTTVAVLAVLI